jgi:hypothetical protein
MATWLMKLSIMNTMTTNNKANKVSALLRLTLGTLLLTGSF